MTASVPVPRAPHISGRAGDAGPSTPRDELARRIAALQQHLRDLNLDAALITQNVDLFYFAGSMQSGVLVVPASGREVYGVRRVLERARRESALERIVPLASLRDLATLVRDAASGPVARVGLELDVLPVGVRDRFAAALDGMTIGDVSSPIRLVRSVKSAYELDRIRAAAALADQMLQAAVRTLREGMTDLEFAAGIEAAARRLGHQGIVRTRGWNQEAYYGHVFSGDAAAMPSFPDLPLGGVGPSAAVPYGAGHRRILAGEPVIVDYVGALDGYLCDQTRTLAIGALPAKFLTAYDAAVEILRHVEAAIRPGAIPQDLYRRAVERAGALGYTDAFMGAGPYRARYIGHGVGLELDEWPVLADGFTTPLQPGVVFCVEPKIVFPGEGVVGIEDQFAVTADGAERLTLPDRRLFAV
jgi:Xaa-Pro dipeptidase